jgi:haloalkane dehalogenase
LSVYRTPDERFDALVGFPFAPRYREQDGLRMHYIEEGTGKPVLLLHGEPTWAYLYRKLVPALAGVGRVVAPDYFGFGRSDKPTEQGWYSYDRHYDAIARLVRELDLRPLTLVVHDWGGPIGLRLAVESPERVERLVVLNTGIGAGRAPSETWLRFRDMVRRVGAELSAGRMVAAGCARDLPEAAAAAYDAPFPTPESKAGLLAFPELVPTELDHPSAGKMLEVREAARSWSKPALVLFGDSDPIFPPRAAERMSELIGGAEPAQTVANAGHFVQEDAGEELGERIAAWLTARSEPAGRYRPSRP